MRQPCGRPVSITTTASERGITIDDLSYTPASQQAALANNWAEAIEGPNEPDLNGRSYEGFTDTTTTNDFSATRRYQEELFQAAKGSGSTMNKPVLSPAMGYKMPTGALVGSDYNIESLHSYAENYMPSYWRVDSQFIPKTQPHGRWWT